MASRPLEAKHLAFAMHNHKILRRDIEEDADHERNTVHLSRDFGI